MKSTLAAITLLLAAVAGAHAAETDGTIAAIDPEGLTITLDNGETFKLPGEIDVSGLEEGMEVLIAYDEVDGEKQITDMALPE